MLTRFEILACLPHFACLPARTRICQRLRRALIRSQLPPVLNERFRALAVRTHSLSQVAMRPLAARRVIRAVRATGRRA